MYALLEFIGKTYQLTKEKNKNARRYRVLKNCDAKQRKRKTPQRLRGCSEVNFFEKTACNFVASLQKMLLF